MKFKIARTRFEVSYALLCLVAVCIILGVFKSFDAGFQRAKRDILRKDSLLDTRVYRVIIGIGRKNGKVQITQRVSPFSVIFTGIDEEHMAIIRDSVKSLIK